MRLEISFPQFNLGLQLQLSYRILTEPFSFIQTCRFSLAWPLWMFFQTLLHEWVWQTPSSIISISLFYRVAQKLPEPPPESVSYPFLCVTKVFLDLLDFFGAFKVRSCKIWFVWFIWTISEQCSSSNEWTLNFLKFNFLLIKRIFLKLIISSIFSGSKHEDKTDLEKKIDFLPQLCCQLEYNFNFWQTLLSAFPDDVL